MVLRLIVFMYVWVPEAKAERVRGRPPLRNTSVQRPENPRDVVLAIGG